MIDVIPAILEATMEGVQEKLDRFRGLPARVVHLDIMDGVFVPAQSSFLPGDLDELSSDAEFELHLMVEDPETVADSWARRPSVHRVLVHAEVTHDAKRLAQAIQKMNKEVGMVLNIGTSLSRLQESLPFAQAVQCMGIRDVGAQAQAFDASVLPVIRELRRVSPVPISVDGGVNDESALELVRAGASRLVVGSYLLKAKTSEEMQTRFRWLQGLDS